MNLKEYLEKHGPEALQTLAAACGVSAEYLNHCIYGYRRPSVELAEQLVANDPHKTLTFESVIRYKRDTERRKYIRRSPAGAQA